MRKLCGNRTNPSFNSGHAEKEHQQRGHVQPMTSEVARGRGQRPGAMPGHTVPSTGLPGGAVAEHARVAVAMRRRPLLRPTGKDRRCEGHIMR